MLNTSFSCELNRTTFPHLLLLALIGTRIRFPQSISSSALSISHPTDGGWGIIFTPRRAIWAAQLTPLRLRSRLINNETNLLICFARCADSAGSSLGGLFVRRASRSTVEHARVQEFAGANPRNAPVPRVEPGFYFWKLQSE